MTLRAVTRVCAGLNCLYGCGVLAACVQAGIEIALDRADVQRSAAIS